MSGLMKLRRGERLHAAEVLASAFAKVMAAVDRLQVEGERLAAAHETADGFEVQAIEHLDFEPRCNARKCDRVARWNTLCTACGAHVGLTCEPCRLEVVRITAERTHDVCGVRAPFRDLVRFLPLSGA